MLLHLGRRLLLRNRTRGTGQVSQPLAEGRLHAVSRACNSNHEMYSEGGKAYFTMMLGAFGQSSSVFWLQNKNWTFIGLDTAYVDGHLDADQIKWLGERVAGAGRSTVGRLLAPSTLLSTGGAA